MKEITVGAAIIYKINNQGQKEILATQRGYGELKGMWEFPGGKIEKGETTQQCVVREIREELNAEIRPIEQLCTIDYDYPTFHLKMHCIICQFISDCFVLKEHTSFRWLDSENLKSVNWLPADLEILDRIETFLKGS